MSFEPIHGFDKFLDRINELEFQEIARAVKALAAERGLPQKEAVDQLIRQGPAATLSALRQAPPGAN